MEQNMKKICLGEKSKDQVVTEIIQMYRKAYNKANEQSSVLVDSLSKYMTHLSDEVVSFQQNATKPPTCPERLCLCGLASVYLLVKKKGPNEGRQFYACSKQKEDESRCQFFEWDDSNATNPSAPTHNTENVPFNVDRATNSPNCHCGNPASLLTVRKAGPNEGKSFYACSKPQSDSAKCQFFSWNEPTPGSAVKPETTKPEISCQCGNAATQYTVRKAGPNEGKQFYACAKQQTDPTKCQFFAWHDDTLTPTNINEYKRMLQPHQNTQAPGKKCSCQLVAVLKTCSKEGPNKSRKFWTCPKMACKCNYFEWDDEARPANNNEFVESSSRSRHRGRGRGRGRGRERNNRQRSLE
jgi:DNA topoisomerase-3